MEDKTLYLNDGLIKEPDVSPDYLETEKTRQIEEIKHRKSIYRYCNEIELDIQEQTIVIIVDDGAATRATIIVAARSIRKKNPKKLIIAVPVTSKDTVSVLKEECDLVVTATTPSATAFKSVGKYHQEFKPVEDAEVTEACKRRRNP